MDCIRNYFALLYNPCYDRNYNHFYNPVNPQSYENLQDLVFRYYLMCKFPLVNMMLLDQHTEKLLQLPLLQL